MGLGICIGDTQMASSTKFRFLLLLLLLILTVAAAQNCYTTGNFTANSTYATNRNLLLSALSSKTSAAAAAGAAGGGFYRATAGRNSDTVYGTALCSGGASSAGCAACVQDSAQKLIANCTAQREAIEWGTGCTVRYSNRNIFGALETSPTLRLYRVDKIPEDSKDRFHGALRNLTDELVPRASAGSGGLKLATGEAKFGALKTIYSRTQCTPDLSAASCGVCLREAVKNFQDCCREHIGGVSLKPSCEFRFEDYPFYDSTSAAASDAPPPISPPLPPPPQSAAVPDKGPVNRKESMSRTVVIVLLPITVLFVLVGLAYFLSQRRKPRKNSENGDATETEDSLKFNLATIRAATNDFSVANTLGRGGFGSVFKGKLPNRQEIAVKRLAECSGQGEQEFKNEILLLARLQHKNLVRLIGFCLENEERLLIYEYMPNGSLDRFIFDPAKRKQLDWGIRYKIIYGIARGILYLHEDSKLRIIHHDLKSANVLLDGDLNPKIADFGLARLFLISQSKGNTERVAGTYGYMPPEYVKHGQFSLKTDVFSFGVLILEIISGKNNKSFHNPEQEEHLLSHAWKNWRSGTILNLVDSSMRIRSPSEIIRCIHVGLLCVQENVAKRPTMASVFLMLNSVSVTLPTPTKPAFLVHDSTHGAAPLQVHESQLLARSNRPAAVSSECVSVNEASISELYPR